MHDLVISNARIVDGTGSPAIPGGVAVSGGKIAALGPEITEATPASRHIDAKGHVASPGFIDLHSHSDAEFLVNDRLEAKLLQGVTSEVIGQCGLSLVPTADATLQDHLTYSGMLLSQEALASIDWKTMRGMADYGRYLDGRKFSINAAPLIGQGTLRIAVMGFKGGEPSPAEQEAMETLLDENLRAGAWGLSLGLVYPPGSFTTLPELVGLARVVAKHNGIIHAHIRGESVTVFDATREMIDLARQSGAHVHISHFKLIGKAQWGRAAELLAMVADARKEGVNIDADQYPYTGSSTGLGVLVPKWAMEGGLDGLLRRLAASERGRVVDDISAEMDRRGGPEAVMVTSNGRFPEYDFRRVKELAAAEKVTGGEMVARILEKTRGTANAIYFSMDQKDMLTIMASDFVSVGSDGYALNFDQARGAQHPRSFGTFPRFIRTVLDERIMPLEKAVWKITGLAASMMGMRDRGVIAPDKAADLVIFDPDAIRDTATFENAFQKPEGISTIIVNGKVAVQNNALTDAREGVCLRHE